MFLAIALICLWPMLMSASASPQLRQDAPEPRSPLPDVQSAEDRAEDDGEEETWPTFFERSLRRTRPRIGFTWGLTGFYSDDVRLQSGQESEPRRSVVLNPRIFTSVERPRSALWLEYSLGYRLYNRPSGSGAAAHYGLLDFERRLSTRTSLGLREVFRSGFNDFLSPDSAPDAFSFAQVDVPFQRITNNSLEVSLNSRVGRRTTLGVFGSHDFWRYSQQEPKNNHGIQAGAQLALQIKEWLFLDNRYSHYLMASDNIRSANIHRLEIGALRFATRGGLSVSFGGGVDATRYNGPFHATAGAHASVSKTSAQTEASITYHRGLSTAVGGGFVLSGHNVTGAFKRWLSRRVNLTLSSQYTQGSSERNSELEYISGQAELGVALQRHLLLSGHYWYISQKTANLENNLINSNRYTIGVGLHYSLPSLLEP